LCCFSIFINYLTLFFPIQATALAALQEASEAYLVLCFQKWNMAAVHCKRCTVLPKDIKLVQSMQDMNTLSGPPAYDPVHIKRKKKAKKKTDDTGKDGREKEKTDKGKGKKK
jgi:hypothetical protein